jgi:putative heme-binding domain-containing protein
MTRFFPNGAIAVFFIFCTHACAVSFADDKTDTLEPLVKLLADIDDAEFQRDILNGIHKAINGRRNVKMPASWNSVSRSLLESRDPKVRNLALELGVIFGDPKALTTLRNLAANRTAKTSARTSALKGLLQKRDQQTLAMLKTMLNEPAMRGAAIRGLAFYNDTNTPKTLLAMYSKLSNSEKQDALATLAARPRDAMVLLQAIEKKIIPHADVSAFLIRQMSTFNDQKLDARIRKVWGSLRPLKKDRKELIATYKQRLTLKVLKQSNRVKGRVIFKKTCASCHRLFDDGQRIGPELTGSHRTNLDYLLENLLDPNAVIGRDYRMTIIVTNSGRLINGIVKEESAKTITLQTANEKLLIAKTDIDIRKQSSVSLMPEGQLQKMKTEDIRDLFGYLMGPTQTPLPKSKTTK